MSELPVHVSTDHRARLVMAVLAASEWPEKEQAQEPHAVHQHAKQTRHFLARFRNHAAVLGLARFLDGGVSLGDLFSAALRCSWPNFEPAEPLPPSLQGEIWVETLPSFRRDTGIESFWVEHSAVWDNARRDLSDIFQNSGLAQFLHQFRETPLQRSIAVIPSIVYPMLTPVVVTTKETLCLVLPPAKAWGESPPWPYDEDPGWVVAQTCWHLTAHVMVDTLAQLDETQASLLRHAAVVLCLEQEFDQAEAMAYLVRSKKEHDLPQLPMAAEKLRHYLDSPTGHSLDHVLIGGEVE